MALLSNPDTAKMVKMALDRMFAGQNKTDALQLLAVTCKSVEIQLLIVKM